VATRSRSSKPAPKKPAAKAAPKRKPAARKPAARKTAPRKPAPPSPVPRILAGLGLTLLGLFLALLLWFGIDGSFVGSRLTDGSRVAFGSFAIFLPVILVGCGALVLQKNISSGMRRRLAGAPLVLLALLLALSNDVTTGKLSENAGGFIGGHLHKLLGSAAGDAGVLLVIVALAVSGVVLLAGQKLSVLWQAFWETCVDIYNAIADRLDDAAARRALAKDEAERQALIEHREASRTRKAHVQPLADEPEEIVYPDPIHEQWGDESAQAEATAESSYPPAEPTPVPVATKEPTAEPSWEEPVADTPESIFEDDESGEPTINLALPAVRRQHQDYKLPDPSVLGRSQAAEVEQSTLDRMGQSLVEALESFGVKSRVIGTVSGPRVTRYEIQLAPGTKVGKVSALKDDLAYALATTDIRILAPIPGKQAVGVEVPNTTPNLVTLGDIQGSFPAGCSPLTVWLGKDISGNHVHADLAKMPHVLIAGTTGSGKSGSLNAMLVSILLNATPDEVKMILIDPKRVELNHYEAIPHLLTPVVTNMKSAAAALMNVVGEMERRYEKLGAARSRNIVEFNKARIEGGRPEDTLPYVLVVIDELADLMMVAPAEVEDCIIRLAQKSRAVGIHLVLATQRPSVDVITGMIKANVPSRIAFAVSSMTDSRVILDTPGAESLLGQGDMLYRPIGTSRIQRIQGAFVGEDEVGLVVEQCRNQAEPEFEEGFLDMPQTVATPGGGGDADDDTDPDSDPLLEDALRVVCNHDTASVSLLQRRLRVGYTRAGRLIDMLERRGAISGYEGSKPRQVLINEGDIPRLMAGGAGAAPAAMPAGGADDDPPWSDDVE
jgi:S-DNA-T family DNA segregation ATPase FtsK/SpoIIIE